VLLGNWIKKPLIGTLLQTDF